MDWRRDVDHWTNAALDLAASHCMCGASLPSAPLIANALLSTEALSHCLGLGIIHLRAGNHTTGVRVYV